MIRGRVGMQFQIGGKCGLAVPAVLKVDLEGLCVNGN